MFLTQFLILLLFLTTVSNANHLPDIIRNVRDNRNNNALDSTVTYKSSCFGYEENCKHNQSLSHEIGVPKCQRNLNPIVAKQFYDQADFGYLKKRIMKHDICISKDKSKTNLKCSDQLRMCHGTNMFLDFSNLNYKSSKRYRTDVIQQYQIGGNCENFDEQLLVENLNEKGYLTSWSDELQHFQSYKSFDVTSHHCDFIFERPVIMMKLDAAVNMYHHFCDFLNLYASMHLNDSFNQDIDIIWYDTHPEGFIDQFYGVTWEAFSNNKPYELKTFDQQRVCFRSLLMPLLARQVDGLFYNTPLVPGCSGSALFQSFREFILHRLQIPKQQPELDNIRVLFLHRSTKFRQIVNARELVKSIGRLDNVTVNLVDYNERIPFINQLNRTSKADVFIGMHGAGLTHLLFLPDWAAVFEVYNCGDEYCYKDLARLRGVQYFTWPNSKLNLIQPVNRGKNPTSGIEHKKFANYHVDVNEFTSIVKKMIEHVRRNPKFVEARRFLRRQKRNHFEL